MSIQYVRDYYKVPAKRGGRIMFDGWRIGTILSADGPYLRIRFDDRERKSHVEYVHPTWRVDYLDAVS
jgi:hypothetical protein